MDGRILSQTLYFLESYLDCCDSNFAHGILSKVENNREMYSKVFFLVDFIIFVGILRKPTTRCYNKIHLPRLGDHYRMDYFVYFRFGDSSNGDA